ncbi:MAG: ATP-binding protein [Caldilineaceae bacterium SB0661_bin_34]|nr:ATP-binding protein [Caldilineaceae bacterium SB0661_bin_34]
MFDQAEMLARTALPADLVNSLYSFNPWWESDPMPPQPLTRRHLVARIGWRLASNVAPVTVVRGPRQIGKSTALNQLIGDLLDRGTDPRRILRIQFDDLETMADLRDPLLRIAEWFERHVATARFNTLAHRGERAYLFFDELQNLSRWDSQLKSLVDNSAVKVVVTGSSALRIELGRDSLAGRIDTIEAGVLSLTEIGELRDMDRPDPFLEENGPGPLASKEFWKELRHHGVQHRRFRDKAFGHFSARGGYPVVHREKDRDFRDLSDYLNETVIKRVIQHDLRQGARGRKRDATLLEEVFRLCCRYAGQTPSPGLLAEEARLALGADISGQRVGNYLKFLNDTLLVRLIPPLEIRLKRKRGSPKLCLADHGLRVSWLQEEVPLAPAALAEHPELTSLAGHLAESVFGSVASTIRGLDIAHYPERGMDREVDFVLTVGAWRIPVEIKYQRRIDQFRDTLGLRSFLEKSVNNAPFGVLITQDDAGEADDPRIVSLPLSTFMLLR